jgi:uncharacterized RDD family membrane protein YckC
MSQVPDRNAPGDGQAYPPPQYGQGSPPPQYGQGGPQTQYGQGNSQTQYGQGSPPPQYGQGNPQAMMASTPAYGMPGMSVPPGMYYDPESGLILPKGTTLASHGLRIGAYFLAGLLWIVTLFIGYVIWGAITWRDGRTPTQQLLGMRCWKPQTMTTATWGTMLLRGLSMAVIDGIAFGGLVSFVMFLVNKDRRTLYDHISGVVVLHDPNKVLSPV